VPPSRSLSTSVEWTIGVEPKNVADRTPLRLLEKYISFITAVWPSFCRGFADHSGQDGGTSVESVGIMVYLQISATCLGVEADSGRA